MRGAEAIKEMDKGHARFQRGSLGNQGKIVRFLDRTGSQHCPTGLAASHYVRMVAKNGKGMRCHGAGRDMEDRAGQFAGDLEHIGDHQ